MQESHFLGFFLVHQEVDGLALIAELTLRVGDLRTDICQIPYLFRDFGPDGQFWLCRRDSLAELHIQLNGVAAGLKFAGDNPATHFINQRTQNASVHGIYPALIVMLGMPSTYDIVTILVELHMESDGIVRTATETIIPLMVAPRVYYFLHFIYVSLFFAKGWNYVYRFLFMVSTVMMVA